VIKGRVIDHSNGEPLAFVNISGNESGRGTVSDIDGKFTLQSPTPLTIIRFSYIGYEPVMVTVSELSTDLVVTMKRSNVTLREVVVRPGENPAYRIIRNVIQNSEKNNPENFSSFSYDSYNKMVFSVKPKAEGETDRTDSSEIRLEHFLTKQHLFLMESVSERYYTFPGKNKETITASRVSGLKDPSFALIATQMQSFSFFGDYISIWEKNYLSPIAKGSLSKYEYTLEDTVFSGVDTVFIISFMPHKNKNFEGMKGLLYINTSGYAIQNVIAEPAEAEANIHVKIQQQYEKINNEYWFPVQLNTDVTFLNMQINKQQIFGSGKTYIENIKIGESHGGVKFKGPDVSVASDANKKTEEFWQRHRSDSLNIKDQNTYLYMDSLGKAENLDAKIKVFESLISGYYPYKFLNFDLNRVIGYNLYEGFRFGLGVQTNNKLSEKVHLGGWFGYGLKDKAFKYGAEAQFNIHQASEFKMKASYKRDVAEAGEIFYLADRRPLMSESYRPYLINIMDSIEKAEVSASFKPHKYLSMSFSANHNTRTPTFTYAFTDENETRTGPFSFYETALGFRFAYGEKFFSTPGNTYSMGTKYPVVWFQYVRGHNPYGTSFSFDRYDVKAEYTRTFRNLGISSLQIIGGYIDGNIPYSALYAGRGSFVQYSVSVANTFETMGTNEFLSSSYASAFFEHNFGSLLLKNKFLKPEIILVTNIGIGTLANPGNHSGIDFNTLEKGYYESGMRINNILTSQFSGIGVGCFYRYGPYSNAEPVNNLAIKFTVTFRL
jgi:hypothetical protein